MLGTHLLPSWVQMLPSVSHFRRGSCSCSQTLRGTVSFGEQHSEECLRCRVACFLCEPLHLFPARHLFTVMPSPHCPCPCQEASRSSEKTGPSIEDQTVKFFQKPLLTPLLPLFHGGYSGMRPEHTHLSCVKSVRVKRESVCSRAILKNRQRFFLMLKLKFISN